MKCDLYDLFSYDESKMIGQGMEYELAILKCNKF
jgi:hypothetical protein